MSYEQHPQQEACRLEFQRLREEIKDANKDTKSNTTQNFKDQKEIIEKITAIDESTKSAHIRIGAMEKHTEAVIKLSVSVDNVVKQMSSVVELYEGHNNRINTLENKPAQTVYGYFQIGLTALITGLVGLLIGMVLKNGGA